MGNEWTALWRWVKRTVRSVGTLLVARWKEIALAASYFGGWACLTWGVAGIVERIVGEPVIEVWGLSVGLLLLAIGGLGLLKDVALEGFYVLSRVKRGER